MSPTYAERFETYFQRPVAQKAAHSLSNGVEIELEIIHPESWDTLEAITFTREKGGNKILKGAARSPQIRFSLSPEAADQILADTAEDVGTIGVNIMKLVMEKNAKKKVSFEFKAGFLSLMTKGYFGVITAGGAGFASYLASRGLNGMGAIKAAFSKLRKD